MITVHAEACRDLAETVKKIHETGADAGVAVNPDTPLSEMCIRDRHNTDYVPLKVRSAIVPAANLGSQLFWPLFLIGLIFSLPMPDKLRFCRQRPLPRKGIKSLQSRNLDKDKNNERKDRTMGQLSLIHIFSSKNC